MARVFEEIKYSCPIVLCRTLFTVPRPEGEMQIKDHDSYFILTMDSKSRLKDMCILIFRQFVHWNGIISVGTLGVSPNLVSRSGIVKAAVSGVFEDLRFQKARTKIEVVLTAWLAVSAKLKASFIIV